jgi:alanine-glyoxylate transaminase/serine-glyoxylate transaminase/serine-pyruvate transaminase
MRAAWAALSMVPVPEISLQANTLSALRFPPGMDRSLVTRIAAHGVVVAGGLHPLIRDEYFRVGHMGYAATQPEMLVRTVAAIESALLDAGAPIVPGAAVVAARSALIDPGASSAPPGSARA